MRESVAGMDVDEGRERSVCFLSSEDLVWAFVFLSCTLFPSRHPPSQQVREGGKK